MSEQANSETDREAGMPVPEPGMSEYTSPDQDIGSKPPKPEVERSAKEAKPADGKKGSRVGGFLRKALRWLVLALVVFTIGVVAMQLVRVQPLGEEVDRLNQSLVEAEATQVALQSELDRLAGVEAENEALTEALLAAQVKLSLLDILVDISRAQLALAQEDSLRVADALQGTGEKLSSLRELYGSTAPAELEGLHERIDLVLTEVVDDPFAAERDLEILANTLLEIERELSGD